jgi:hypothetical protein
VKELFEQVFRNMSEAPEFITNDLLVKGADGEYWHQKTRDAFKWFQLGLLAAKGEQDA